MISDCSYCGILELNATAFFLNTFALLIILAPGAIFNSVETLRN